MILITFDATTEFREAGDAAGFPEAGSATEDARVFAEDTRVFAQDPTCFFLHSRVVQLTVSANGFTAEATVFLPCLNCACIIVVQR